MVDRMDQGLIPAQVVPNTYDALWQLVSKALYRTHVEGKLKVQHHNTHQCPAVCSSEHMGKAVANRSDTCVQADFALINGLWQEPKDR